MAADSGTVTLERGGVIVTASGEVAAEMKKLGWAEAQQKPARKSTTK